MPNHDERLSTSILGGPLSAQVDFGLPFQREVVTDLEGLGFHNESTDVVARTFPDAPPFAPDQEPVNTLGLDALAIGFGLFVATKLSEGAITQIGSDVYRTVVKPRVEALWARLRGQNAALPVVATFDHWFDGSRVLVRVVFYARGADPVPDVELVQQALGIAERHIAAQDVVNRVLTFEVRDGVLSAEPQGSDPLP